MTWVLDCQSAFSDKYIKIIQTERYQFRKIKYWHIRELYFLFLHFKSMKQYFPNQGPRLKAEGRRQSALETLNLYIILHKSNN